MITLTVIINRLLLQYDLQRIINSSLISQWFSYINEHDTKFGYLQIVTREGLLRILYDIISNQINHNKISLQTFEER